jgi:integrase/recombinase XerD
MMLEELQRRNFADSTIRHYIRWVEEYARFFGKSPEKLGLEHLRTYQAHLLKTRKLSPGTVENHVAALRFLYVRTLKRYQFRDYIPYPRMPKKLPGILSREEVARLINASGTLFHRTLLMVLYGTGMRRAEAARLKLTDIDSQRMIIRVINGKGRKDRDLPLSPALLETLRAYWRCFKPLVYLFPSRYSGAVEKPITDKAVWHIAIEATRRAGIRKRVTPHTLRHSWATHLLEDGTDLRTIQLLLGHENLETTARYLHLSATHLQQVANPIESLPIANVDQSLPSRRRAHQP